MNEFFKRLKEDASTGLDMSPGNANSAWAVNEIEALQTRVTDLMDQNTMVRRRNVEYAKAWQAAEALGVELAGVLEAQCDLIESNPILSACASSTLKPARAILAAMPVDTPENE